ncbi:MAG: hypothetical protein D6780_03905 [Candidatus Dadabacteria bacterium]|nr:MAG: hypothetical protein D6780_03905 [Candidatus Dadabacteria bacterium]
MKKSCKKLFFLCKSCRAPIAFNYSPATVAEELNIVKIIDRVVNKKCRGVSVGDGSFVYSIK